VSAGSAAWWAGKIRQARRHLGARVSAGERAELESWLTPAQLRVFDAMQVSDRRHGLDVVAWLRADGMTDPEVLVAGLIHDAGKGDSGFVARVLYALSQAYGPSIWGAAMAFPRLAPSMRRLRAHAELSARLAAEAGCSPRTVELIRHQDDPAPLDPSQQRLHLADEAS
jgi:hypothetical protein